MAKIKDRRKFFRDGLHKLYLPYYDQLCDELPKEFQPYFGKRTLEEQNDLFQIGRYGDVRKTVTDAKGYESPHVWGMASDWCLFTDSGAAYWPALSGPDAHLWNPYREAITMSGLKWGGEFKRVDAPHNELRISLSWKIPASIIEKDGYDKAIEFIQECMF